MAPCGSRTSNLGARAPWAWTAALAHPLQRDHSPQSEHTCHESRQETLKTYQRLGFGTWINFPFDTIYVRIYQNHTRAAITLGGEVLGLLRSKTVYKSSISFALWSDIWQEYIPTHNRYMVLEALPEPVGLSIIHSEDGFSTDKEGMELNY